MSLRVLIADDHHLFRAGLCSLLEDAADVEVVAEAEDGVKAVESVAALSPDLVIMDMSMPRMDGVQATRRIVDANETTRVLCVSMHAEKEFVDAALSAGASGYLLKECAVEELLWAIDVVRRGRIFLSPDVATTVVEGYRRGASARSSATLSPREREVLQLIAAGRSTKEIAADLDLSTKTVSTHREHLMGKLGIATVAGLTKYAIREGLSPLID